MSLKSFDMLKFIECLQNRPEIYHSKYPDHSLKKREKIKEMALIFNISGKWNNGTAVDAEQTFERLELVPAKHKKAYFKSSITWANNKDYIILITC